MCACGCACLKYVSSCECVCVYVWFKCVSKYAQYKKILIGFTNFTYRSYYVGCLFWRRGCQAQHKKYHSNNPNHMTKTSW